MKNKFSVVAVCCLLIIVCIITTVSVSAENNTVVELKILSDGISDFKLNATNADSVQAWIDGDLTNNAGITSEWYIMALARSGKTYDFATYLDSLTAFLENNKVSSASSRQKYALTLIELGRSDDHFVKATLEDSIGEQGIMSFVYGLKLLNNNNCLSSKFTASEVVSELLSLKLEDGGWSLYSDISDIDVTAMTLQALAPYYDSDINVKTAVDEALTFLSDKQLDNGDYSSFGTQNPESTAQVLTSLSLIGIDALNDSRFIKNGNSLIDGILRYKLPDGSFCHVIGGESNHTATVQVFYSLMSVLAVSSEPIPTIPQTSHDETTAPVTTNLQNNPLPSPSRSISYKVWAYTAIFIIFLSVSLVLWLRKKRHIKNYIFVLVIVGIAVCFVTFTDFQTTNDYYNGQDTLKTDPVGTVTLSISCDTVLGKSDSEYIPDNGIILPVTCFNIEEGNSVFDILIEATKKYGIQLESAYGSSYVSGINYLYELQFGDMSGWIYHVNGIAPSVGCGDYSLSDGDAIEWIYTCELGNDLDSEED